jgi:hypothetical protein
LEGDASDVATRPAEACHQAKRDRIGTGCEYDRNGCGRRFRRQRGRCARRRCKTRRRTRSAAISGSRSSWPSAQRNSIATLRPSTKPDCARPWRNPSSILALRSGEPVCRKPITGIATCCARAASGHAAAAPPSAAINFRRPILTGIYPFRARLPTERTIPRRRHAVFIWEGRREPRCTAGFRPGLC